MIGLLCIIPWQMDITKYPNLSLMKLISKTLKIEVDGHYYTLHLKSKFVNWSLNELQVIYFCFVKKNSCLCTWLQKICIKYRKHGRSSCSSTIDCLACYDPKKYTLLQKFNVMIINFFVRTLQCAETLIFVCTFFAHENVKKQPQK